ncbi:hypothetical protein ILUMI_21506 [Ignelater luminosus]|uniref:Integrase catalytic domain-containing protein n=1 Tax=Ignelater luminosus TaxID=2038154 RepID=A0A8K0G3I3_IGNLU|nr:hypothetical protein ILUMI_21506 [Ignelater luminosus]
MRQRVQFFEVEQNQGESINDWFVRVKKAAMECKFQASLDEYVKNKLITGMCRGIVLDMLCEEDVSKSLQKLIDIAVRKEAILQESVVAPINKLTICKKQKSGRTKTIPKFKMSEQKSQSKIYRGFWWNRPLLGRDMMKEFNISLCLNTKEKQSHCLEMDKSEVNENTIGKVTNKIKHAFSDLFDGTLGKCKYAKVRLNIAPSVLPKFCKPCSIPFAFKAGVEQELNRMEREGIITKIDNSKWATPLVPIIKGNKMLKGGCTVQHPQDVGYFCSSPGSLALAWSTHNGIYKVNRLPFGIKSACKLFQREVEKTLQGYNLLDYIIVTGSILKEHINNLQTVTKPRDAGFKLNPQKCEFLKKEIYLGYIISSEGLQKDLTKVQAIQGMQRPTDVTGITVYGKFIPGLSTLLSPLYKMLQKDVPFKWNKDCDLAIQKTKEAILSSQVLTHINPEYSIVLECDAANEGIGAVLLHGMPDGVERPICFISRTLNRVEKMNRPNSMETIEKLRETFARFGLPKVLVSDNGVQFTSSEFDNFCVKNGIKHVTSPMYQPASNGAAKNTVKIFKTSFKKMLNDNKDDFFETIVNRFLFSYRTSPHTVTGEPPSKLMFSRSTRNRFDFLNPKNLNHTNKAIINTKIMMLRMDVEEQVGKSIYFCKGIENDLIFKRHQDQIIKTGSFFSGIMNKIQKKDKTTVRKDIHCPIRPVLVSENKKAAESESTVSEDNKSDTKLTGISNYDRQ